MWGVPNRFFSDGIGLQILSEATGKPLSVLLEGMMEKLIPPLSKRKLIPLKHLPQQTGFAATMTYCLQQKPPLVTLVPVRH